MSSFRSVPPVVTIMRMSKCLASSIQIWLVCRASSRVGTTINAEVQYISLVFLLSKQKLNNEKSHLECAVLKERPAPTPVYNMHLSFQFHSWHEPGCFFQLEPWGFQPLGLVMVFPILSQKFPSAIHASSRNLQSLFPWCWLHPNIHKIVRFVNFKTCRVAYSGLFSPVLGWDLQLGFPEVIRVTFPVKNNTPINA